jgi:hypothetical protein
VKHTIRRILCYAQITRGALTMTALRFATTLLFLVLAGCGAQPMAGDYAISRDAMHEGFAAVAPPTAKARTATAALGPIPSDRADAAPAGAQGGQSGGAVNASAVSRKIIYDAQIDLVVESVDPVAKKVTKFVADSHGYIAEQNVTGSPGSQRSMRWRIRVPVDSFDSLVDAILSLGELERNNRTSQDVTEQYYDLESRIKNKKVEEQTLNKILQERSGKLEDVLKIEIELSRVRGEIEQLEGKIRVLENLASLATLTVNVREREKYAPAPPVAADFPTQIARTWDASLLSLINLGKAFALWAVSWAIWIPVLLVIAVFAWILIRWLIRVFMKNLPRLIAVARTPITQPHAPSSGQ